ncbi:hypothetical protein IGI04_017027 [Brassica rapa subsp. trilocularis]|uniref:Uncharacterized protein n=1 Tax=Brassica rapa subsp. trilocularis TaxID=1813537 RepID=A0ABQ7MUN3_BRACM|nr:hypothetical protein IGI04_030555 [Brassica rapa subsp. trilocularis]KAG5402420.1 hypothetical protein IGI04_017027 [Brassica rapa subsp. trilocularis]
MSQITNKPSHRKRKPHTRSATTFSIMANENSSFQELAIGTTVSFKRRSTGERFHGSVFYFSPQLNGSLFGIQNVGVWRVDGRYERISGFNHFNLNDITELQVNVVPRQNSNTQDAQNNNNNDGSSSKSIGSKMGALHLDPPSK